MESVNESSELDAPADPSDADRGGPRRTVWSWADEQLPAGGADADDDDYVPL